MEDLLQSFSSDLFHNINLKLPTQPKQTTQQPFIINLSIMALIASPQSIKINHMIKNNTLLKTVRDIVITLKISKNNKVAISTKYLSKQVR